LLSWLKMRSTTWTTCHQNTFHRWMQVHLILRLASCYWRQNSHTAASLIANSLAKCRSALQLTTK
jgi:hypothetical protein